jgi:hypothetical protein
MKRLYDNYEGYEPEARHIGDKMREFVVELLKEYPEYSALELSAIIHGAAQEAFNIVSVRRRLSGPPQ